MNLETFKKILDLQKECLERSRKLYELGVDLIEYEEMPLKIKELLLEELFTEESIEWFDWYCYENDFGRGDLEAWDENKNPICRNVEELYKLMKLKKHD